MHRVIAGCSLWALALYAAAFGLGFARSPWHLPVGVFAAVFAIGAQSAIFAMFMGASKLLQEHVERFALPAALVARTNALMFPLFRRATLGALSGFGFALVAGLGASGDLPLALHVPAAIAAVAVLALVVPGEVRLLAAMHEVLADLERELPGRAGAAAAAAPSEPPLAQAEADRRRARALAYVGATTLAMVLGYRFISRLPLPGALVLAVAGLATVCLLASGWLSRRARRAGA